jgi:predicted Rossmann-fold nucleotide-binding protein
MEKKEKTVAVFCSADENVSDTLKQEAKNLGEYLSKHNYELLLGGTEKGKISDNELNLILI